MSVITLDQLDMAIPPARYEDIEKYHPFLDEAMEMVNISTGVRQAAFLAQIAVESANLSAVYENLNYSANALIKTWPSRFWLPSYDGEQCPPNRRDARLYHRQPEKIANACYGGRYGNGPEETGDGWKFRGRGLKQVTFHDNYLAYSRWIGDPSIMDDPDQLGQPRHAALSAAWYWDSRNLNELADYDDEDHFHQISYKVNGGWNGKQARFDSWIVARGVLA